MKNVIIDIGENNICISHHGEEVVYWHKDEWSEDPSIIPSIANAIHLAHTDIMKLRETVSKPLMVGDTVVPQEKGVEIEYCVLIKGHDGRTHEAGCTDDYYQVIRTWDEMKEVGTPYNEIKLLKSLVKKTKLTFVRLVGEVIAEHILKEH